MRHRRQAMIFQNSCVTDLVKPIVVGIEAANDIPRQIASKSSIEEKQSISYNDGQLRLIGLSFIIIIIKYCINDGGSDERFKMCCIDKIPGVAKFLMSPTWFWPLKSYGRDRTQFSKTGFASVRGFLRNYHAKARSQWCVFVSILAPSWLHLGSLGLHLAPSWLHLGSKAGKRRPK